MIILAIVMIALLLLAFFRSRASKTEHHSIDEFWEREQQANSTQKKDISNLNYIQIPLDRLPFQESEDEKISEYQRVIKNLSQNQILNLTGISNTDLKIQYGAANIDILSLADQRFTTLARTLNLWGNALFENGQKAEAATVLEFAVDCKSDVSSTYTTLALIYKENDSSKIDYLINVAESLNSLSKSGIISKLEAIKNQ